jgi:hypothetical protein
MAVVRPSRRRIIMKPPPPKFPAAGYVTASAKATATAASTALPPRFMTSTPTREAIGSVEATIPRRARTGGRDAARATPAPVPTLDSGAAGETKKSRTTSSVTKVCLAVINFALAFCRTLFGAGSTP